MTCMLILIIILLLVKIYYLLEHPLHFPEMNGSRM